MTMMDLPRPKYDHVVGEDSKENPSCIFEELGTMAAASAFDKLCHRPGYLSTKLKDLSGKKSLKITRHL